MQTIVHAIAYNLIALALLTSVGNAACRLLLDWTGMTDAKASRHVPTTVVAPGEGTGATGAEASQPNAAHSAGWIIGWLERLILAVAIVAQSWEILAAVVALKSVARFKELDDQLPAEYFLTGSLFSVLWAMMITAAWLGYDHRFGIDVHHTLIRLLQPEPATPKIEPDPCVFQNISAHPDRADTGAYQIRVSQASPKRRGNPQTV